LTLKDLSELERKTYEFIKKAGEIQPKNMCDRKMLWIRKVTGEDIRSTFKWLSKDPPFASKFWEYINGWEIE
jgi:hypothetical protein